MAIESWQALIEIEKRENRNEQKILDSIETSSKSMYGEWFQELERQFQTKQEKAFYKAFLTAYGQAYYKREKNKKKHWSRLSLVLSTVGTAFSGTVVVTAALGIINTALSKSPITLSAESFSWLTELIKDYGLLCLIIFAAVALLTFSLSCLKNEVERRKYGETWVRHSVTYHKLNIAVIRYLSGLMERREFMEKVLGILEDNVGRFEHNMSYGTKTDNTQEDRNNSGTTGSTG